MPKSVKTIMDKADLAVSDLVSNGGYLNPVQANTFIRMMINYPTLLKMVRVVPMSAPTMQVNKIGFGSRILKAAPASGTALPSASRSKPTTSKVTLSTKEVIAEVHIPYDVLEDNIEGQRLEDTIMAQIAERAALDLEELLILGDTTSLDTYLALMNGVLAQATSHIVDYTAAPVAVTKTVFKDALKAMPNQYLRDKTAMRHFVSPHADIEYADSLGDRATVLGDSKVVDMSVNRAQGVPLTPCALMPNDKAIFTHPKNLIYGIQRKIMIESDRDIRARVMVVVLTLRLDIKFEEEDAVVKVIGLNTDGATTTTT